MEQGQTRPPTGVDALAVFDASVRRIVVKMSSQTWLFEPASGEWREVDTLTPQLNFGWFSWGTEMTYDPASRRTVVFSDGILATFDASTGKWTTARRDTGWPPEASSGLGPVLPRHSDGTEQRTEPTIGPLSRLGHGLVADVANGHVLVLGGKVRSTGGTWQNGSDVWAYRVASNSWTEVVPAQPE